MLRLYLLRHGETDYNKALRVQGSGIDAPLNDTGRYQAHRFFQHYKNVPFDAVYCSTLQRTYQTLQPFESLYAIHAYPELNELSWGIIEGKPFEGNIKKIYENVNNAWAHGDNHAKIEGGESPQQVWERCLCFLQKIVKKHPQGNILICTHGRTLKILLANLLGYGLHYQEQFVHANTALTILTFQPEFQFFLETLSNKDHLL